MKSAKIEPRFNFHSIQHIGVPNVPKAQVVWVIANRTPARSHRKYTGTFDLIFAVFQRETPPGVTGGESGGSRLCRMVYRSDSLTLIPSKRNGKNRQLYPSSS